MQTLVFLLLFVAALVLAQSVLRGRAMRDPHTSADSFARALAALDPAATATRPLQRVPASADMVDEADQGSTK